MGKTKKTATTSAISETLDELTLAKNELAHWQKWLTDQGYDLTKPHAYSDTLAVLEKNVKDLS